MTKQELERRLKMISVSFNEEISKAKEREEHYKKEGNLTLEMVYHEKVFAFEMAKLIVRGNFRVWD